MMHLGTAKDIQDHKGDLRQDYEDSLTQLR